VSRIVSGLAIAGIAVALLAFALILAHAAAVFALDRRFQWGFPASTGAVAAADLLLALILLLVARPRLTRPVLKDTRETFKKAAAVLRG
jgi:hypothetical protein